MRTPQDKTKGRDQALTKRNPARIRAFSPYTNRNDEERPMGRGLLLWLIGIPLPIILIIWLFGGLS